MVPAERPSLNDSAKAISALLCLQRAFSMQNLVAPPMPTHQADTMDDAVYRNGKIERGKAFCAHSPCYEESVREDVAGKPCHSQNIQSYIFCETRFFRATGSQYREPLARGDQSRRRGAESHRSKHKYKEPPELRRRRLFVFNQLNVWKYCL